MLSIYSILDEIEKDVNESYKESQLDLFEKEFEVSAKNLAENKLWRTEKMSEKQENQKEKNKPILKYRVGAVVTDVWENKTDKGTFYTVSQQRSYKQGDAWGQTSSLRVNDLPKAVLGLNKAYEYILTQAKSDSDE